MGNIFTTERRVEFCETDAAGITHFSAFLCYMEQAEHALFRALGTSVVHDLGDDWHLSWPRVHVECDFTGTARFEDVLQIDVQVLRLGGKSVTYGFSFLRREEQIARGKTTAVCCRVRSGHALQSIAIPELLRSQLTDYLQPTPAG